MCLQSTQCLSNSLCICCVSSVLFLLSVSSFGNDRIYFVSVFALILTVDPLLLLVVLKMPSVFVQQFTAPLISCLAFDSMVASMFMLQLFFQASSASIESMFILIILSAAVSGMPNNA